MSNTPNSEPTAAVCALCGEPMPVGEEMFKYHGYSGLCPKPPLPLAPIDTAVDEALRKERIEIAEMLEAEASRHEDAARDLRADYPPLDVSDEAFAHDCDARLLNRWAETIRARTPAAPASAEMTDDIAF